MITFGSLMTVLALGAGCGSSSTSPSGSTSPQGPGIDFTININGDRGSSSYAPSPLTMRVGQVVNWHNLDSIEHTATLDGMFDSGRIPAVQRARQCRDHGQGRDVHLSLHDPSGHGRDDHRPVSGAGRLLRNPAPLMVGPHVVSEEHGRVLVLACTDCGWCMR